MEALVGLVILAFLAVPFGLIALAFAHAKRAATIDRLERDVLALRLDLDGLARVGAPPRVPRPSNEAGPYRGLYAPPAPATPAIARGPALAPHVADDSPAPLADEAPVAAALATSAHVARAPEHDDGSSAPVPAVEPTPEVRTAAREAPWEEPVAPPATRVEWERWLGVRGAAALGALVLVVAGLMFFKYSIDRNILTPPWRIALGVIAASIAIGGSERVARARHAVLANWLAGAGIAILYTTTWAARALYELASPEVAFGAMLAITALCTALSIRHRALPIALLGLTGGFSAPLTLAPHGDHPVPLFFYLLVLDGAFLFVAARQRWSALALVSLGATSLYEALWIGGRMSASSELVGVGVLGVFALAFASLPVLFGGATRPRGAAETALRTGALIVPMALGLRFAGDASLDVAAPALAAFLGVLAIASIVLGRRAKSPLLPSAALAATLVGMGLWVASHTGGASPAFVASLGALVAIFQVATEIDDSPAAAVHGALATLGGLALIAATGANDAKTAWASVAGLALFTGLGLRQVTRKDRGALAVLLAIASLAALVVVGHAGAGSSSLWASALVALPLAFLVAARASSTERGAIATAAIVTSLLAGLVALSFSNDARLFVGLELGLTVLALVAASLAEAPFAAALAALVSAASLLVARHGFDADARDLGLGAIALATLHLAHACVAPRAARASAWTVRAAALALPLYALTVLPLVERAGLSFGAFAAMSAALAFAARFIVEVRGVSDEARGAARAWFDALAIGATTTALALTFHDAAIVVALALFGLALVVLGDRATRRGIVLAGLAHVGLAAARALDVGAMLDAHTRDGAPVLNELFAAYAIPSLVAAAIALRPPRALAIPHAEKIAAASAIVLAFVGANVAVLDAFATGAHVLVDADRSPARDLTTSMVWAVFALALLGLGMRRKNAALRWTSLALVLVTALKVFLVDLADLHDLYRVASLVGLATSLILISTLYQRFVLRSSIQPAAR